MLRSSIMEESDNPWAKAAANQRSTRRSFVMNDNTPPGRYSIYDTSPPEEDVDPDGCGHQTFLFTLQLWHVVDGVLGMILCIYGFTVLHNHPYATLGIVLLLGVGSLLLLRSISGSLSLYMDVCFDRLGLLLSAGTSPVLASLFLLLCSINIFAPWLITRYLEHTHIVWKSWREWHERDLGTLDILLFLLFVLECVRWQLVLIMYERLELLDTSGTRHLQPRDFDQERPWWWPKAQSPRRNDLLEASLLPVSGQPESSCSSWWPFGRAVEDPRDDGSVDFASVQEEWATRSLEDPHWWAHETETAARKEAERQAAANATYTWADARDRY